MNLRQRSSRSVSPTRGTKRRSSGHSSTSSKRSNRIPACAAIIPSSRTACSATEKTAIGRLSETSALRNFSDYPQTRYSKASTRIAQDNERSLNAESINHAHRKGWLTDWERKFCFNTMRKRNLSERQLKKRIQINDKVLRLVARNRPER
jgi:hypothetical protein